MTRSLTHLGPFGAVFALVLAASPLGATAAPAPPADLLRGPMFAEFASSGQEPAYPEEAVQARKSGLVIARVTVGPDGHVTSVEALSGETVFGAAVEKAVADWTFAVPTPDGTPYPGGSGMLVFRFAVDEDAQYGKLLFGKGSQPCTRPPTGEGIIIGGVPGDVPSDRGSSGDPGVEVKGPLRVSGGVLAGRTLYASQPPYPPMAKQAGIEGSVVVEAVVDELGMVVCPRAISGHPLLRPAAEAAARQWIFSPTLLEGTPVKVIGTITFNFRKS